MSEESKTRKNVQEKTATELFFWAQALVFSLVVLVVINIFFFRISGVVGSSMYPTLHEGDRVIMRVINYKPQRGDIVVVVAPEYDDGAPLVKRIIAVGGDVIDINSATGAVTVNGEELYEPYINELIRDSGSFAYPMTVDDGYVFFMGDNRNHSTDSRSWMIGPQPESNVVGKVIFRVFPLKSIGKVS